MPYNMAMAVPAVFPTRIQLRFLQAILSSDEEFTEKIQAWERLAGHYADLDESTLQLFPLLYKRLSALEHTGPLFRVAKSSYRHHWLRNSLLMHSAEQALHTLRAHHIPSMILKGGALLHLYYQSDMGSRKLEDIDIFVPKQHFSEALQRLHAAGWAADPPQSDVYFDSAFFHAVNIKKDNATIDLHCHVLHAYLDERDWELFRGAAQQFQLGHIVATALGDSDQLVHTCAHGLRWSMSNTLRWIPDAAAIIRRGTVDWDRVAAVAEQTNTALHVQAALAYLQQEFAMMIPQHAMRKLQDIRSPLARRRLFRVSMKNTLNSPLVAIEAYWWHYYNSLKRPVTIQQAVGNAIRYLKFLCQTSQARKIPYIVSIRFGQLLMRSLASSIHRA